jgi:hypothetical protein
MAIRYTLWSFGILFPVLVSFTEKNLATLIRPLFCCCIAALQTLSKPRNGFPIKSAVNILWRTFCRGRKVMPRLRVVIRAESGPGPSPTCGIELGLLLNKPKGQIPSLWLFYLFRKSLIPISIPIWIPIPILLKKHPGLRKAWALSEKPVPDPSPNWAWPEPALFRPDQDLGPTPA